ncbi:MAG: twin-arginine translocase subunit TatC [Sedimenticola sp.]
MTNQNDPTLRALQEQPFVSHLIELRDRLMRVVIAVVVVFFLLFPFANDLYQAVSKPLLAVLPDGQNMIATGVISPFLAPFKLALVAAIFIGMPLILYQLWSFIAPGLYKHEKRVLLPMVGSSALLFYCGALFAYFVVFPLVFQFMKMTTPGGVDMIPDITQYLEFVLTLFFAFGLAFEVPIATIILVWMGVSTPDKLREKRPFIIVGAFCLGMLLTPPDVISQTLLALPMWLLFEVGLFFSRIVYRDKLKRAAAAEEDGETATGEDAPLAAAASAGAAAAKPLPVTTGWKPVDSFDGDHDLGDSAESAIDPERFTPLTEEELDAQLDIIEREEEEEEEEEDDDEGELGDSDSDDLYHEAVEEKLRRVKLLRDEGNIIGAKGVLYEILSEGNDEQGKIARSILDQLDEE